MSTIGWLFFFFLGRVGPWGATSQFLNQSQTVNLTGRPRDSLGGRSARRKAATYTGRTSKSYRTVISVATGRGPSGLRPRLSMHMFVFVAWGRLQEPRVDKPHLGLACSPLWPTARVCAGHDVSSRQCPTLSALTTSNLHSCSFGGGVHHGLQHPDGLGPFLSANSSLRCVKVNES
jgi:hypothetical protein